MIKQFVAITSLMAFSATVSAQIYRCEDLSGNPVFQDAPCDSDNDQASQPALDQTRYSDKKREDWMAKLYSGKPSDVYIIEITNHKNDTHITYDVTNEASSNTFIQHLAQITQKSVTLESYAPINSMVARAVAVVKGGGDPLLRSSTPTPASSPTLQNP